MYLKRVIIAILLGFSSFISAQTDSSRVLYSLDFRFNDGFFFNFRQVKQNNPTPFNCVITNSRPDDADFIDKVTNKRFISYYNDGKKQNAKIKDLWGYAKNGILYINIDNHFFRLTSIGSITFFIASVEVEYINSGLDPWGYSPVGRYNERYKTNELKQFLLNFTDGMVYPYHYKNVAVLLSQDDALFQEYTALKRRKRKQLAVSFIKRYNKKHPLYFPVSK